MSEAVAENSFAVEALAAFASLEDEFKARKEAHCEKMRQAKGQLQKRIDALNAQIDQLDAALGTIKGHTKTPRPYRKRDIAAVRDRVVNWMTAHAGERYRACQIAKEFKDDISPTGATFFMNMLVKANRVESCGKGVERVFYVSKGGL